jgi:hypothetical protein
MSASSGVKGTCEVCKHQNNEHNPYECTVKDCKNKWMICQAGGHQELGVKDDFKYIICVRCDDHRYNCEIDVSEYEYKGD